jgi:hypothetical protein
MSPATFVTASVRGVRYDLLLTPDKVVAMSSELDSAGDGGLYLWQVARRPPEHLSLLDKHGHARDNAIRGCEVTLLIDLPHAHETAVVACPTKDLLTAAVSRVQA